MKHNLKITIFLALIFFLSQLIGLIIISQYIDIEKSSSEGKTIVKQKAYNFTGVKPPELEPEEEKYMWIFISVAILLGTVIVLVIIRFKKHNIWKFWFLLSITVCLFFAFAQFINNLLTFFNIDGSLILFNLTILGFPLTLSGIATILLVIALAYYKIYKKSIIIHNFTELFVYGGLAALIVPAIAVEAAIILLIIISLYDMIAVWKTKHMVVMAKFQTQNKLFAGLLMPYDKKTGNLNLSKIKEIKSKNNIVNNQIKSKKIINNYDNNNNNNNNTKTAILGGGDIAFPLIFAGTVMKTTGSFLNPIIIAFTTTIALFLLLTYGKKNKFYPAMPFISAGCFLGYAIVLII
ncbi:MAG: presenilin family intramembrane aspartyl protease [Nanoarchaeota archaeon]